MAYVRPTTYLDTTPPGLNQADLDQFHDEREAQMIREIGVTPPDDPTDPFPDVTARAFRDNRATVIGELASRSRAMRIALNAAATVTPTGAGGGVGTAGATGPIPVTTSTTGNVPSKPRCGGISTAFGNHMAWTGGGRIAQTIRAEPKSELAYRPSDFKEYAKIVKDCKAALSDEHRLGLPQEMFKEAGITFRLWNQKCKVELEERGMDGEFRILLNATTEVYLMDEFGSANHEAVVEWVDDLRKIPSCPYEEQNLMMSAKFLLGSIKVELLEMVERNVRENASGPEVYAAIVNLHQRVSTSAVRKLVETLDKMSLKNEPGENVPVFVGKVTDLAKRIIGTGSPPIDLIALIYKPFTKCSVETFRMTAISYYERADEKDPLYRNWESWLLKLQMRYQRDCDNNEWEPVKHLKEPAGMTGTTSLESRNDSRTCYHCGKKGHIKPFCPDKDKPAVGGQGARSTYRTAPEEGSPHTKLIDGVSNSWCGICKKWNNGKRAHLTAEHKVKGGGVAKPKVEIATLSVATTNVAPVANLGAVECAPVIHYMGGYVGAVCESEMNFDTASFTVDCWEDEDDLDRDADLNVEVKVGSTEEAHFEARLESPEVIASEEGESQSPHLNCRAGRRLSRVR